MATKNEKPSKPVVKVARKTTVAASVKVDAKETCFTIMPFGGWFDDYYESIYKPAIEKAGLKPRRADDLYRPSTIVNDIWSCTKESKLVLADLTGKNPNVFYELGLAHALAKPAILVAESMNDVPFDLRALRVIEYDKNEPRWGDSLRDKIVLSIGEVLASPLASVPSAFIETKPSSGSKPISEHELAVLELRKEMELLKRELRTSDSRLMSGDYLNSKTSEVGMIRNADEARTYLLRYMKMGMSDSGILRRMVDRGVPREWLIEELKTRRPKKAVASNPIPDDDIA